MSDVKDILGLNAAGASPKKPKEKAAKKKYFRIRALSATDPVAFDPGNCPKAPA